MMHETIENLIDIFTSGLDRSILLANRLELALDEQFADDDAIQEAVEMLACYRPEGGDDVIGPERMAAKLIEIKAYLGGEST